MIRLYDLLSIFVIGEDSVSYRIMVDNLDMTDKINEQHINDRGLFKNNEYSKEILNRYEVVQIAQDDYTMIINVLRNTGE